MTQSQTDRLDAMLSGLNERHIMKQPAILLLGEPGSGKTFSLATLARNRRLFMVATEAGAEESLIDGAMHYGVPIENLHWHYVPPSSSGWEAITNMGKLVNTMSYEDLGKLKTGIDKGGHKQFLSVMGAFANFRCQRTGEAFGPVDEFGDDCVVALDSLSGLNDMAKELTVGGKPTLHQGEWGTAMETEIKLIKKLVHDIRCVSVMTGHLDKLLDELAGRMSFQVSLLGNKLAPAMPRLFSDVIFAYREHSKYYWSTTNSQCSGLKGRNLGLVDKAPPDFGTILSSYERRMAFVRGGKKE